MIHVRCSRRKMRLSVLQAPSADAHNRRTTHRAKPVFERSKYHEAENGSVYAPRAAHNLTRSRDDHVGGHGRDAVEADVLGRLKDVEIVDGRETERLHAL